VKANISAPSSLCKQTSPYKPAICFLFRKRNSHCFDCINSTTSLGRAKHAQQIKGGPLTLWFYIILKCEVMSTSTYCMLSSLFLWTKMTLKTFKLDTYKY